MRPGGKSRWGVCDYVELGGERSLDQRHVSSRMEVEKSGLRFGSGWVVDRKRPQKMKEPVEWILGQREAA